MEDLSKIKVGGITYNIKDAAARTDITELSSQISDLDDDVTALETAEGQTRGMISDAWTQKTWTAGEYCIYNNKLWKCIIDNSKRPSEGDNWTEVSISDEITTLLTAHEEFVFEPVFVSIQAQEGHRALVLGNIVILTLALTASTSIPDNGAIGTILEGYRPAKEIKCTFYDVQHNTANLMRIKSDGTVSIDKSIGVNNWLHGTFIWVIGK